MTFTGIYSIEIQTDEHGVLQLRKLSLPDIAHLNLLSAPISDREFVVKLLHNQLLNPRLSLEVIQGCSDALLAEVAIAWAQAEGWDIASDVPPLEAFRSACRSYCADLVGEISESITKLVARTSETMRQTYAVAAETIRKATQSYANYAAQFAKISQSIAAQVKVFENLPRITADTLVRIQKVQQSRGVLEDTGYGFTLSLRTFAYADVFYPASQTSADDSGKWE